MKIKIIASNPVKDDYESDIDEMIGNTYIARKALKGAYIIEDDGDEMYVHDDEYEIISENDNSSNIKIITNESGDWEVLKVDEEEKYSGHSIPNFVWLELLNDLGHKTSIKEISDEDMENGDY